ncbi:hypothetical protein I2963_24060 [Escherichia coli]|nr:hypothetical protein [Escherichia coli]
MDTGKTLTRWPVFVDHFTQAEYRWIEMFGHGKRMNMPWWGGFDPRAWDVASLMDFAVPVVACLLVWLLVNRG